MVFTGATAGSGEKGTPSRAGSRPGEGNVKKPHSEVGTQTTQAYTEKRETFDALS